MNSTNYYTPETQAKPNYGQQDPNQPHHYQNQPNYGQQYHQNFSQESNNQQGQYNSQQNQHSLYQPFNPDQNPPNHVPQRSTPFIPTESSHNQQFSPQQPQLSIYELFSSDENPPKNPQLDQGQSNLYRGVPIIDLSGFTPYKRLHLEPAKTLSGAKVNKFGIAIDITEETSHEEDSVKYPLYTIQGETTRRGQFSTTKGYVDFVNIEKILTMSFPGADKYLRLPHADLFVELDDNKIQARRDGLANFLKTVACSTDFFYSPEFQKFLATGPQPAKIQVNYLKIQHPSLRYNNLDYPTEEIMITIVHQFEKKDLIISHVEYTIQGTDSKGDFTVNRRYSDFVLIREILVRNFPYVPFGHLPVVTSSGASRLNGLIEFLRNITKFSTPYYSPEWQAFIRYTEPDVQKKLKSFKKPGLF